MEIFGNTALAQIISKSRDAYKANSATTLSAGEAVAAALVLNRPDWLAKMGYTLAEAIERIGPEWARLIPAAATQVQAINEEDAYAKAEQMRQAKLAEIQRQMKDDDALDVSASLVTYGNAPGYRDVSLTFDIVPIGAVKEPSLRVRMSVSAEDGESISKHILEVHKFAWSEERPIDAKPNENIPR